MDRLLYPKPHPPTTAELFACPASFRSHKTYKKTLFLADSEKQTAKGLYNFPREKISLFRYHHWEDYILNGRMQYLSFGVDSSLDDLIVQVGEEISR